MRRRQFLGLIGGAAAWPVAAKGQQVGRLATIGFLGTGAAPGWQPWTATFVQRLRDLGWIEGRNLAIEYRWGEGQPERYAEFAAEFVRLKVDAIVTGGSAVRLVNQATSVIPIVFVLATDPIGGGLVASLSRPGGNVTGSSNQGVDLASKRLELLREVLPRLRRLAILGNAGYPDLVVEMGEVELTARGLGVEATRLEVRRTQDIAPAFATLNGRADALYVVMDGLVPPTARASLHLRQAPDCRPS